VKVVFFQPVSLEINAIDPLDCLKKASEALPSADQSTILWSCPRPVTGATSEIEAVAKIREPFDEAWFRE
jgi:hypothetical protein